MLVLHFNNWFYATKTLRTFFWLRWIASLACGAAFLLGFLLNIAYLITLYGGQLITMIFSTSLLVGSVILLVLFLQRKSQAIVPVLLLIFLPSTLLTAYGVTADLYLGLLLFVSYLERKHRKFTVTVVSQFSREFSPIYDKRLANKNEYRLYRHAYMVLDLLDTADYTLTKEITTVSSDKVSGLSEKELTRTFKIKGILGRTTVKDALYTSPQKKFLALKRSL